MPSSYQTHHNPYYDQGKEEEEHTLNPKFKHSATANPTQTTNGPVIASKSLPLLSLISLAR
jgi:hypothetical protein